ncbi:MAG: hypothetical protein GC153_01835 [Alphaproteobacteria bacterium]|nr:hypothetical protein [Alphaproteobacteria bacterium]
MKRSLFGLAIAVAAAAPAAAQESPARPAPCSADIYHAFDFWLGDWEVFDPKGAKAGDNSITREEGGCLIVERWTGAKGGSGQSFNFYDEAAKKWRQVWVSRGVTIDYTGGLNEKGEMALEGTVAYRNGKTAPFRGVWTPLANGDVRQHFEEYNPDAKTWDEWFTGIYKKKPSPAP